ncbi:MAG TPA: GntR family transcriptional regulator [Kiloniellaceae bacterium]|nr:GntR family transcriptional regulator [Kiloniellaceae bacterium]
MVLIQTAPSLAEQVYQAILDDICEGRLPPTSHLVQEQLADRFGVSRQPIQQAMALLKADGLVEEVGRRGLYVAELDPGLMRHHYDIRAALDRLAAGLSADRAQRDPALAQDIAARGGAILARGRKAMADEDTLDLIRADEAFHRLLYEASGNPLLSGTAESHWRFLRRAMSDVLRHAQPPENIWRQHAGILEAVVDGDRLRAETLAAQHIEVAADSLSAVLG